MVNPGVKFFEKNSILAWGCCPPDNPGCGWGGKAPPDPLLKRSFVTFDRGGQTGPPRSNDFFFGAAGNTGAARTSGSTSGRTPGRTPADDTGAADDRPTSDEAHVPGQLFSRTIFREHPLFRRQKIIDDPSESLLQENTEVIFDVQKISDVETDIEV